MREALGYSHACGELDVPGKIRETPMKATTDDSGPASGEGLGTAVVWDEQTVFTSLTAADAGNYAVVSGLTEGTLNI